jgi:signal transduction histidine kinase
MQTAALSLFDTEVLGHATEGVLSASPTELPEPRMFLHDLRNLAQAIVGPADTLEIALEENDMNLAKTTLDRLRKGANCFVDLFGHLAASSSENVQRDEQCDVAQVIEEVVDSLAPTLIHKNIRVHQRLAASMFAPVSRTDLYRVLLNLLINAIDATDGHGDSITVTARQIRDEWVVIRVSDDGCGVPKEDLSHIFEEGYTTKAQNGGNGLGLALVKQVVEAHRGTVRVWSQPGKGTRFTVRLPGGENGNGSQTEACSRRIERGRSQ